MRRRLLLALVLCAAAFPARAASPTVEEFLARHWRAPLAAQGRPPARFSAVEASLAPGACATCHPAQFADWRTSLHARTMGPGVAGQLVEMLQAAPGDALGCYTCHAPLAEQRPLLGAAERRAKNPAFDETLAASGLVCAGCHVRAHERFGPPRRDGTFANPGPRETLPHDGVTRSSAFLASEFCRGCHQFRPDGLALNGKLVENTYQEWKASRFAREGVQCQGCHMPDRRHVWRGIHDAEMVRSGLTIAVEPSHDRLARRDAVAVTLRVTSTRIGHAFPTYVVPRVILRGEQLDGAGVTIAGTRVERIIAREVALDLSKELRDTRLLPGRAAELRYRRVVHRGAARVRLTVIVEPDAFYTGFFEALLEQGAGHGEADLRRALDVARRSPYTLFERVLVLGD